MKLVGGQRHTRESLEDTRHNATSMFSQSPLVTVHGWTSEGGEGGREEVGRVGGGKGRWGVKGRGGGRRRKWRGMKGGGQQY